MECEGAKERKFEECLKHSKILVLVKTERVPKILVGALPVDFSLLKKLPTLWLS